MEERNTYIKNGTPVKIPKDTGENKGNTKKIDKLFYLGLLIVILLIVYITHFQILISYIPSASMEPTIKSNSFTLSDRTFDKIENGDIVYFKNEEDGAILVKRVIATEGQVISLKNSSVYIDGAILKEDYLKEKPFYESLTEEVPEGALFVMGDNRNDSKDSRIIGCIDEELCISVKKQQR